MKTCPSCAEEVLPKAKKCKHCSSDLRPFYERRPILTFFVGLPLFLMFFTAALDSGNSSPHKTKKINRNYSIVSSSEAYTIAKIFVKEGVNYPETAKVDFMPTVKKDMGGGRWSFSGNVKAKNAFGVESKTRFIIDLSYKEGEKMMQSSWEVNSLLFE